MYFFGFSLFLLKNEMTVFKAKFDWWLVLVLISTCGFSIYAAIADGTSWIGYLLIIGLFVVVLMMLFKTSYSVDESTLKIYSFPFYNKKIPIESIVSIEYSRSLLSAPAPSLMRLEIIYNKYDSILISPQNREAFIDEVLKHNANVKVKGN